ncbi:hypothetical protein [Hyphococcus sp.]|jgi:hypothetical protein|uniref:hypothetical protein n=1 Tax=Hyphococcus sp. TaxID=2038636 RepID=UPI003D0D9545
MTLRTVLLAALAAGIASCGGEDAETPADEVTDAEKLAPQAPKAEVAAEPATSGALTAEGWENLRIGMTKDEIAAAYGADANPNAVGGPEPDVCDEFHPENAPDGMRVMLTDGRLARITIGRDAKVKTGEGLGLGASAREVKDAYGDAAEIMPHKYAAAPAEYITVWDKDRPESYITDDSARGLRYVVGKDGTVEQIHAGGPAIQLVEGCL